MSLPLILRPAALEDMTAIRDWYERQQSGLGGRFAEALQQTFERIKAMPEMYAAGHRGARRAKVKRFPIVVYYRVRSDRIDVFAVLHGGRDARVWQDRI